MRYEIILTNYLHLNISQSQIFHSEAALLTARRFSLKKTKSYNLVFWSEWRESNSRPLEPHSSALPNWATPGYREYNNTLCFIIQVFFLKKQNFINFFRGSYIAAAEHLYQYFLNQTCILLSPRLAKA